MSCCGSEISPPPDLLLTDPPYCSGGFQESGKSAGSIGTTAKPKQIANDRLSTRGYKALLKEAIRKSGVSFLYCFTDWRMWLNLFDVVESENYGVRHMIVWDKGTPGMGRGWRSQHELIMWATKMTPPYNRKYGGAGNVIQAQRTGNTHNATQKPVSVVGELISNTPFAQVIYDPFAGSGTTILAADQHDRRCLAIDLDPACCDVAVERWEDFTGQKAIRKR